MTMDLEKLQALIDLVGSSGISELEIAEAGCTVRIVRNGATTTVSAQTAREFTPQATPVRPETATDAKSTPKHVVLAPMSGTFYSASSPNDAPFVEVGDAVKSGQVLGLIEAMKTLSPIEADKDGFVTGILVEDRCSVEFGQALFALE
jgi:acetyl-CoA carboxylase biotin carboxyl carrier protein